MQDRRAVDKAAVGVPGNAEADRKEARAEEEKCRKRFVRGLTRSAFGRHYWDDDLETELRTQLKNSKQRFGQKHK